MNDCTANPCPYCGGVEVTVGRGVLWSPGRQAWLSAVVCDNACCEAIGPHAATPAAAVALWNAAKPINKEMH